MIKLEDLSEEQLLIVNDPRPNLFVALNTGVGKTISTLYAIHYKHPKARVVVVLPKTVRDDKTWEKDLAQIDTSFECLVLSKEDFKNRHRTLDGYDVLVIDEACEWLLSGVYPSLRSRGGVKYIDGSDTFACVEDYITRTQPKHIYMLDATPLANKPLHLWAAMWLLGLIKNPKMISHHKFVQFFYKEIPKGYNSIFIEKTKKSRHVTKAEMEIKKEELKKYWSEIAIFADDDRKIKPIEKDIMVEPDEEHKRRIKDIKDNFPDPLARRSRLFCIENNHYRDIKFDDIRHTQEVFNEALKTNKEGKIVELINTLDRENGVIIFSTLSLQQQRIKEALEQSNIACDIVNGQCKDRNIIFDKFRDKKLDVLIVQSSICVGYNMPNCKYVIRASPPIRAAHLQQQYGRIDRAPNYKQNYVYNVILKGGVDEVSFDQVKSGRDLQLSIKDYE